MKIINGRIYNRIAPKTSKIYVINGEIYPAMFASGELMPTAPMVSTVAAQDITHDSVRLLGLLSDLGSSDYVHVFIQLRAKGETTWMQSPKLKIEESYTYFYAQVTNLQPEVEYEYRAGAEWELGVVYGNIYTFTTTAALLDTFIFGPDVTGDLYSNGHLEIYGSGDMTDFSMINSPIFNDDRVITVNIEPGVTSIGNSIFVACHNLTSVNIPNSVTKIGYGAFFECYDLSSIVIPGSVENIGSEAFRNCYKLAEIRNHFIGNQIIGSQAFLYAGKDISPKYAYSFAENTNFKNAVEAEGYVWVEIIIPGGASEATIAISAEGRGAKIASGSSEAIVEVSAEGRGMKIASGSSEATIAISTEGKFAVLEMEWVPLGVFWSGDWSVPEDGLYAHTTGRDRLELLRQSTYDTSEVEQDKSLYDLAVDVLSDAGLTTDEYWIDPMLENFIVPYSFFVSQSHREALRKIAEASVGQVYCDREGIIRIEGPFTANLNGELIRLPTPDIIPTGMALSVAFSPDGSYLAVGHNNYPYITIYKRDGDTFTKLPDPDVLPDGLTHCVTFSPDGNYLAAANNSPYLIIYKRNGDAFIKLSDPSPLPTGTARSAAFSPDGSYLAVAHNNYPYITIYKRDGDSFTKLPNPASLPNNTGYSVAFSPDCNHLVVGYNSPPYFALYKRNGDAFVRLPNPDVLPASTVRSAAFSPDGSYLAVAHSILPRITIYKRDGDTFTKLPDPDVLPDSAAYVTFSSDSMRLVVTLYDPPCIIMYKREGDSFIKLPDPASLPTGGCFGVMFSLDNKYLAVAQGPSPCIVIYKYETPIISRISPDDYFHKDNPAKWSEVANYIEVETQPLKPEATTEVYASSEPVSIEAGQEVVITAQYNHVPCINATASLKNAIAGAQIVTEKYYAGSAEIIVSSTASGTFELVINATPLKVQNKELVVAQDAGSIGENGIMKYTFPGNPLVQTRQMAQMVADTILSFYKDPRNDIEMDWRGNPAIELGDVIAAPDRQRGGTVGKWGYFLVTRQELEYTGAFRAKLAGRRVTE